MLYTLMSSILILVILPILTRTMGSKTYLRKGFPYLTITHTNISKGAATILIVVSHIANYRGFNVLIPLGGVGVALFLVSSGYGLNESFKRRGLDNFFQKRIVKVIIPYWIMVFLYGVLHVETFSLESFLGSLLLIHRLPFMWFIQYIFIWYVLFYLIRKLFNPMEGTLFLIMVAIVFLFLFRDTILGEQSLSFATGVFISNYPKIREYLSSHKNLGVSLFLFSGILFSATFFIMNMKGLDTEESFWLMNIIQMGMKVSLSLFIIQFTYVFQIYLYNALVTIGALSFEIYLSHTLLLELIRSDNPLYILVFFALVALISIGISKLSSRIYEAIYKKLIPEDNRVNN